MIHTRKITIFIFFILSGIIGKNVQASPYRFIRSERLESFSNGSVFSIYQDGLGALWLNTNYGLYRYNGTLPEFKHEPIPTHPICGNHKDLLYVCDYDAILCYDIHSREPKRIATPEINTPNCTLLAEGDQLWIGVEDKIYNYHDDTLILRHQLNLHSGNITSLSKSLNASLLIATSDGNLYEIDDCDRINNIRSALGNISTLHYDNQGDLWIGTLDRGCWRLDHNYNTIGHYHQNADSDKRLKSNLVRSFCNDQYGNLWIGTMSGAECLKPDRISRKEQLGALDQNSIWSFCTDNQGGIWAGTFYDGIYYCNTENYPFTPITLSAEHNIKLINAMVEDKKGDLWILTDKYGMFCLPAGTGPATCIPGSANNKFKSAWYDASEHVIWTGSHMGTLRKYNINTQQWTDYTFLDEEGNEYPETINDIKSYRGELYLGTSRGVVVFDKKSSHIKYAAIKGYDGIVFSMAFDQRNQLWIGGIGIHILDLNNKQITHYSSLENKYPKLNFINLFCDSKGRMWGASLGQGLVSLDSQQGTFYTQETIGLADNFTCFIEEVNSEILLIGTNSGISLFNTRTSRCYNYNKNNGLNISSARSGCTLIQKNGNILIGGIDGIESITPSNIEFTDDQIDIVFDHLYVNNQEIVPGTIYDKHTILQQELAFTTELILNHQQRNLSIRIASFDFEKVYPIFYEYKLKGYDATWTLFSPEHPIIYMNLPPGNYQLYVRASFSKNGEVAAQIELPIKIKAAWYATTMAKILYCTVLLLLSGWILNAIYARMLLSERLKRKEIENMERMRFFINISHELRTPLTLIIGQLELFFRNQKRKDTLCSGIENIESTYRHAQSMQHIISDLLDFEKQNQGYTNIRVSKTELNGYVSQVQESFIQYAKYRNIRLQLQVSDPSIFIYIDSKQMGRVFSNLLLNAFKYTPDGGHIDINIQKTHQPENDIVIISVADSGCGISEESMQHIFDPFYQDTNNTSLDRHNYGTGIGLALSKGIVELHHGNITAQNNRKGGAIFTITLPLGDKWFLEDKRICVDNQELPKNIEFIGSESIQHYNADIKNKIQPSQKRFKMLIVEDDIELRTLLRSIFESGYQIDEASDGAEGYEKAKLLQPDIIISDIVMPTMDGMSFCGKLRYDMETCHIPIILLTAQPSIDHNLQSIDIGADDYIAKPFNIDYLEARCRNLLENRQRMRQKYSQTIENSYEQELACNEQDAKFLMAATEVVEKYLYNKDLNVQLLCQELNISKTVLNRKIKGITGYSPGEFIEMIKFKKAAKLLCEQNMLISEISYELGFSSPKYFTIRFKKQFGKTPRQFVAEHNNIN